MNYKYILIILFNLSTIVTAVEPLKYNDVFDNMFESVVADDTNLIVKFRTSGIRYLYGNNSNMKVNKYNEELSIPIGSPIQFLDKHVSISFSTLPSQFKKYGFYVHLKIDNRSMGRGVIEREGYLLLKKELKESIAIPNYSHTTGLLLTNASIEVLKSLTNIKDRKEENKRIPYKTLMDNTEIIKVAEKQFKDEDTINTYSVSIYKYDPPLVFSDVELCTNMYEIELDTVENLHYSSASINSIEWMMYLYDEEGKQKIQDRLQKNPHDEWLSSIQARSNKHIIEQVLKNYEETNYFKVIIDINSEKYAYVINSLTISDVLGFLCDKHIYENGKWKLTYKAIDHKVSYSVGGILNAIKKEGIDNILNRIETIKFNPDGTVMKQLNNAIDQASAVAFKNAIFSNGWQAPLIPSKWYVNAETIVEKKKKYTEAREFGRAFAGRLDVWANEMVRQSNTISNRAMTDALLDIADWVGKTPGYGNFFLAARCQDIATVGIGQLLVDLTCPLQVISGTIARLDAPWHAEDARIAVLNAEARTNLFAKSTPDTSLNDIWRNGEMLAFKYSSPEIEAAFKGKQANKGFVALVNSIKNRKIRPVEKAIYMQNLEFFTDDPLDEQGLPVTLLRKWDAKWHGKLVIGFESVNTLKIKALFAFRQKVGRYPERPVFSDEQRSLREAEIADAKKRGVKITPFESAFSSPGEAAFAQAWEPYATEKTHALFGRAWVAYSEITSGLFADEETREKRLFDQRTQE